MYFLSHLVTFLIFFCFDRFLVPTRRLPFASYLFHVFLPSAVVVVAGFVAVSVVVVVDVDVGILLE